MGGEKLDQSGSEVYKSWQSATEAYLHLGMVSRGVGLEYAAFAKLTEPRRRESG